ncbi:fatty acid synthase-like [Macrosteles quadrilineatus]|uniref:fatty acid synthase-like n=1 Tax=Macrosteles quadrilineatus TaxID=74068 RepID=UPI0023E2F51D|nr:fatty acid synthase-like [Macrosteles quadrilineatus]
MTLKHEVVISGIGGKFPESDNVLQLQEKLFTKEDLITNEIRWTTDTVGVGKMHDIDTFDASAFKMHSKLVRSCDPTTTQTLERAFEAIIDAGMNPFAMSGHNIAVISASMVSDSENTRAGTSYEASGFTIMGHNRSMVANRISYTFNFTGPSYSIHTSWAGGVRALEQGAALIARGHAEAAVVTTASLIFYKAAAVEYEQMNILTPGGRCRSMDADANGTCRSEGVVSFFLQRASDAKRNYATLVGMQAECLGPRACSLPRFDSLVEETIRNFYKKNKIDPNDIAYLELDGSGIKNFDTVEMNALSSVFFEKRTAPLLVGSVKSNVGNTEASSSFVGITKSIIAMETGMIPPNINYSKPNPDVPALVNGQFVPVTEATELKGDLVSLNVLSLGGTLGHVVIKRNTKQKEILAKGKLPPDGLHRLITISCRHEEGAKLNAEKIQQMAVDVEYAAMVNDVFKTNIPGYLWKSFVVVPTNEVKYNIKKFDNVKQPLWYVFSGMGSQWAGMGRDLLRIPIFAAAVDKCDAVLRPKGLDIKHIITTSDKKTFDNILNCFVAIAAIQIGLVDILRAIGLEPDGMVGHSVGELGCAYADGCFTAEEMVLAAYARGKASLDSEVIQGMMAAIGLGYKEMCTMVPPTVDIACHNASDSCTLSGPTDDVINYVKELKDKGVFAKAVSAGNIAYHSRYIKPVAPKLLEYLSELIKEPKPRSAKWISSSVPETNWSSPEAQLSSAEYHTNNLLSPVLFEEASTHIPDNAIVIEIAPHGLLQAILRRSLNKGCVNIPLTNRQTDNSVRFLLEALGNLYLNNASLDINAIYPPIEYPVSRGTPYISPLTTWDHSEHWFTEFQNILQLMSQRSNEVEVNLDESTDDFSLWREHCIDDQIVLSPAQVLVYIWKLFLEATALEFEKETIQIEDMIMSSQVIFKPISQKLLMTIRKGTNSFGICLQEKDKEGETFLTGKVKHLKSPSLDPPSEKRDKDDDEKEDIEVTDEEFVHVLTQFGYQLGPQFQLVRELIMKNKGFTAKVAWSGNIVTFLDAVFKLVGFLEMEVEQKFLYPSAFRTLTIDPPKFYGLEKGTEVDVYYDSRSKILQCNGLKLVGLMMSPDPSVKKEMPELTWNKKCFIPFNSETSKLNEFLTVGLQVVAEEGLNKWRQKVPQLSIIVLNDKSGTQSLINSPLQEVIASLPQINTKVEEMDVRQAKDKMSGMFRPGESWLIVGGFSSLQQLIGSLGPSGFLLAYVQDVQTPVNGPTLLRPVLVHHVKDGGKLVLVKKRTEVEQLKIVEIEDNSWLSEVSGVCDCSDQGFAVAVVSRTKGPAEVLPVLSKLKYAHRVRCLFLEKNSPKFSPQLPLYKNQLSLGLAVGVLSHGEWGTECLLPFTTESAKHLSKGVIISSDTNLDINVVALNTTNLTYYEEEVPDMIHEDVKCVDYCGTRNSGEKVMGIGQFDSLTNTVTPDSTLLWPVPQHWSMDDATTVPVAFTLAYYALIEKVKLKAQQIVLVHMGSSPVGQAFIAVALQVGADVYTTIDSHDQLQSLMRRFPQLKVDQVLPLEHFDIKVKQMTKGEGVKVVVNCLLESETALSVNALGNDSYFIHLSSIDLRNREIVGLWVFIRNAHMFGISLSNIINADPDTKTRLSTFLKDGLKKGVVKPLKKRIFPLCNYHQATNNLHQRCFDEKTVVIIKPEGRSELSTNSLPGFHCQPQSTYIIIGSCEDLWLDLAQWLVGRGARRLVLAPTYAHLNTSNAHRLDRLINLNYARVMLTSAARIGTYDDATIVLNEAIKLGPVGGIFFVGLAENSPTIAHVDSAARQQIPDLPQFVCLLGGSTAVCQSRAKLGFSSKLVQSEKPLYRPQTILSCLSNVLTDTNSISYNYLVSDAVETSSNAEDTWYMVEEDPYVFLPSTVEDLLVLGQDVSCTPCFKEVATRSPPHWNIKYNVLPVFVLPGISAASLYPFISHLMHPAYCAPLCDASLSVESLAEALQEEILKVQRQGPFNIIGETWSGGLALQLATLLESNGHTVDLFLLEGAPAVAQQWARTLTDKHSVGISLLASLLSLDNKVLEQLSELTTWESQLEAALKHVRIENSQEDPDTLRESLFKSLTALRNNLTAALHYEPQKQPFKGNVHLLRPRGASDVEFCELQKCCQKKPLIHVLEEECHQEAVRSQSYAKIVNQNVSYTWDL